MYIGPISVLVWADSIVINENKSYRHLLALMGERIFIEGDMKDMHTYIANILIHVHGPIKVCIQ